MTPAAHLRFPQFYLRKDDAFMFSPIRLGYVPTYRNRWTDWTEKMRVDCLKTLQGLPGCEVFAPTASPDGVAADARYGQIEHAAIHNLDEAEALAAWFKAQAVDALVICPTDFGDERATAKVAEKLGVPSLLMATKEPPAKTDASLARVSDSYCGTLSIASALHRRHLPFRFAGVLFPDEPAFVAEAEAFVRAVAVVKGLRNARLGQVGVRPGPFETVGYDEHAMIRKFGQNVICANLSDIVADAKALTADNEDVQATIADIRANVPIITVADDYLLNASRFEVALKRFYERNRLSAMAVQCWYAIQREMGISLCALYGRLTGQHMLTACETDMLGALAMICNYQAAMGQALPHFIDWTIQHREDPNLLLVWHCGNAPTCLAADASCVALRSRGDMKGELAIDEGNVQAGLFQFQLRSGPVTFCRLAELDGHWKMLIAQGEIEPSAETLAGTWGWVRVADHARLYRTLVEEGFIHHASMIHGNQCQALLQACSFLDIEPVVVQ